MGRVSTQTQTAVHSSVTPSGHDRHMSFHYVPAIDLTDRPDTPVFCVILASGRAVEVAGADCYQPEGPLTTFFLSGSSSRTIDVWSQRVASFRTGDIVSIRQRSRPAPLHPSAQNIRHRTIDGELGRRATLAVVPA